MMSETSESFDELGPLHAPTGPEISCKGWQQEAALRMLMNNLDPEVAEDRAKLIVYGQGKAARNPACYHAILRSLRELDNDETLLVQSGKPVGIFRTHPGAPRVLIANANLVPDWATLELFKEYEEQGLTMYGQMTAGSWIYIGAQGIIQGTYISFHEAARKRFNGTLRGKLVLTSGLGGMGRAQPLAVTMNGGVCLVVEVNPEQVKKRLDQHYVDEAETDLAVALRKAADYQKQGVPRSIALLGNAVKVYQEIVQLNVPVDIVTDQTSAHEPLNGYVPVDISWEQALQMRQDKSSHEDYIKRAFASMSEHVLAMLDLQEKGAYVFDYGNGLRAGALKAKMEHAMDYPGFVPEFVRPLFLTGKGPFRWVALSGDPADIRQTDEEILRLFKHDDLLVQWMHNIHDVEQRVGGFGGLPARICWLGYGERDQAGLAFNELVRSGRVKAPIVIGRDHLDSGSVASPYRETEAMLDGSDAIADWPILNALLNTASGGSWVSFHHGGGVGIGRSLHAGVVVVADGSKEADERLQRVLTNDPGTGVMRHADAGYVEAIDAARRGGIKLPMIGD